ncbi:MAG: competence/damage-inducible protein A [Acidobacteria bacterium]|nr:competence/damage-inducible protein A [Acidobacteriota bacterium]
MRAEIIAVGSELLTPSRVDTNSLYVTQQLNSIGVEVFRKYVVGDRLEEICSSLELALQASDIVILMGGLGPTRDDLTRDAVAASLRLELRLDPVLLQSLESRFARAGLRMAENNRLQAMVPEGAATLENPFGTAPGIFLQPSGKLLFLLPGPPSELRPMIMHHVLPAICRLKTPRPRFTRLLKIGSEFESRVDEKISPIYAEYPEIEVTILASAGIIELFFLWKGEPEAGQAVSQLEELTRRIRGQLGHSVFTDQDESLEMVLGEMLRGRRQTVATAESCTGGLIGKMLTEVPGSSDYYLGGVVSYSNDLKLSFLSVDPDALRQYGAVSEPVARQMAEGIRERTRADFGISLTGIAGPGGATTDKPVGLVFMAISSKSGTACRRVQLRGDRETIRIRAARLLIDWLRRVLLEEGS